MQTEQWAHSWNSFTIATATSLPTQSIKQVIIINLSLITQSVIFDISLHSSDVDPVTDRLVNWLPFLLEHLNYFINRFHSSVVDLGPRVFMSCPLQLPANEIESWFINLWNHFVIPYLMGAVLAGIEVRVYVCLFVCSCCVSVRRRGLAVLIGALATASTAGTVCLYWLMFDGFDLGN